MSSVLHWRSITVVKEGVYYYSRWIIIIFIFFSLGKFANNSNTSQESCISSLSLFCWLKIAHKQYVCDPVTLNNNLKMGCYWAKGDILITSCINFCCCVANHPDTYNDLKQHTFVSS